MTHRRQRRPQAVVSNQLPLSLSGCHATDQTLDAPQGLGYGILAASSVIKVPQILALLKSKSAEGLAGLSFELENICFTIHASYGLLMGLPINSYGEACFFPQA